MLLGRLAHRNQHRHHDYASRTTFRLHSFYQFWLPCRPAQAHTVHSRQNLFNSPNPSQVFPRTTTSRWGWRRLTVTLIPTRQRMQRPSVTILTCGSCLTAERTSPRRERINNNDGQSRLLYLFFHKGALEALLLSSFQVSTAEGVRLAITIYTTIDINLLLS